MRSRLSGSAVGGALVLVSVFGSVVAIAATSPLVFSIQLNGGLVSLVTGTMPKGWFSGGPAGTSKTELRTTFLTQDTSCSSAPTVFGTSSATQGTLTEQTNNGGAVSGYVWSMETDLSALQNHWSLHILCDGSTEVMGCDQEVSVDVTLTAYGTNGSCRTYKDDTGAEVCASDTHTVLLAAVRHEDVVDVCTEDACGIGPCVSACNHDCNNASFSGSSEEQRTQRRECHMACTCWCKAQLPSSCPSHDACGEQ